MNDQNQHNNPWADKLNHVTVPDANESWKGMNAVLDKKMPLAYQNNRTKWILVAVFMLLLIGVCNCPAIWDQHRLSQKNTAGNKNDGKANKEGKSGLKLTDSTNNMNAIQQKKKIISRTDTGTSTDRLVPPEIIKKKPGTHNEPSAGSQTVNSAKGQIQGEEGKQGTNKRGLNPGTRKRHPGSDQVRRQDHEGNSRVQVTSKKRQLVRQKRKVNKDGDDPLLNNDEAREPQDKMPPIARDKVPGNITGRNIRGDSSANDDSISSPPIDAITAKGTDTAITGNKPDTTVVAALPAQPDTLQIGATGKVAKTRTSSDKERFWTVGIGLNQFFPIGRQEASTFNSNGTSGVLSDYIPVPQVRYYFREKLYMQFEIQINTPQYTKDLLAKQLVSDTNSQGQRTKSSVLIKKLFYMNIPVSVHYSPFKNVYFGAGLQFSRLSNAVALFEESQIRPNNPDSFRTSKVQTLKTDPVYRQLRTNELRFLIDASYQWNKLTFGVRYNQAFTNFIDVRISNTEITQARNSSLQLYLRYRLWRKKPS